MPNARPPYWNDAILRFVHQRDPDVTVANVSGASGGATESSVEVGHGSARLELDVTATDGNLDVTVEDSDDDSNFDTVTAFTTATGVTTETIDVTHLRRYARVVFTFDGTSASFTVTAL